MMTTQHKKNNSTQIRMFDQDGYRKRADCICFRDHSEEEVCAQAMKREGGREGGREREVGGGRDGPVICIKGGEAMYTGWRVVME